MILIQLSFDFPPSMMGEELVKVGKDLADSINNEAGFISKIWTENPETGKAGGIYLFEDKETAENYMDMHAKRIQGLGIEKFDVQYFSVNETLSKINHGI